MMPEETVLGLASLVKAALEKPMSHAILGKVVLPKACTAQVVPIVGSSRTIVRKSLVSITLPAAHTADDSILLPIERFRASVRNAAIKIRLAPPSVMQALTTQMCHAFTLEEVIEQAAATTQHRTSHLR